MRKLICLLALIVIILPSCGAKKTIEVVYYIDTNVPTFTCVTGIEGTRRDTDDIKIYTYKCDKSKTSELADEYMNYLKEEHSYTVVESNDDYEYITLVKEGNGVIVDASTEGEIEIVPYRRIN